MIPIPCLLQRPDPIPSLKYDPRLESSGAVSNEGRTELRNAVGKGELDVGSEELLDVGAADVLGLLDLDNTEDLMTVLNEESNRYQWADVRGST